MKALLLELALMLRDFATSKKVLTALLTGLASVLVKDPTTRTHAVEIGLVLIGGQALTDHGKAAAEIAAASPKPDAVPKRVPLTSSGPVVLPLAGSPPAAP